MKFNLIFIVALFSVLLLLTSCTGKSSPSVKFEADVYEGKAPLRVHFTNESSKNFDYLWDFGDGSGDESMIRLSNTESVSHTFREAGEYFVTLFLLRPDEYTVLSHYRVTVRVGSPILYHIGKDYR